MKYLGNITNEFDIANKGYVDKSLPLILGTQTTSTNAFTGVAPFSQLVHGQSIRYWLPYAGTSSGDTLNLTLCDGSTTGAIQIYWKTTTKLTTHYAAGSLILMTYLENANINGTSYTGWWCQGDYNSDTKTTTNSTNTSSKIYLIGATSQGSSKTTYSHDTAYVGTDGCLYSNSTKVSVEGHTHSEYALASHTHSDYVSKSSTGVQTMTGGLNLGGTPTAGTGVGRLMITGHTNPLIGLQAIDSSGNKLDPYYFQVSNNVMYLGPTSALATQWDRSGNVTIPTTLAVTSSIKEGGTALSDKYAPISHTHNYAGSSSAGGSAISAVKLDTATAGSATQPVYFTGGKPTACTYTLGKSVPSNAVFTDTVYTHPSYTASTGVPTANATLTFGGTFTVSQPVSDATGHITALNTRTYTMPSDRLFTTLTPSGTKISTTGTDLNTIDYIKVGRYYCSANATAKTLLNCPTSMAFMMEVYSPLSTTIDNETTSTYVYRLRKITEYNTGIQYIQYVASSSTAGTFTYNNWYVVPRAKFTLDTSDTNDGSAQAGSTTQPVYVGSDGTLTACTTYAGGTAVTLNGSSKAASTASFYAPTAGGTSGYLLVGAGTTTAPTWKSLSDAGVAASGHTHQVLTVDSTDVVGAYYDTTGGYHYFRPVDASTNPTLLGSSSNPWYKLWVERIEITEGRIVCLPIYSNTVSSATNMYVSSSGTISRTTTTSSRTVKHDIKRLKDADVKDDIKADKLYDLDVVQFKYNDEIITDTDDCRYGQDLVGFIIEEMNEIYPIAVDKPSDDVKEWSWNPHYMIPPMLKLIQEQHEDIESLKAEIKELKKEN